MIYCALIGFGRAGIIHYRNLTKNNLINLKYVCDLDVEKVQKEVNSNIIVTNNLNLILSDELIKLVIVSTPTRNHYNDIKKCLEKGKHVLSEKPLADTHEQIEELFNLAEEQNINLLCGLNRRFDPEISKIKERIEKGEIGKVNKIVTISRDYPYPKFNYLKTCGGIFHDCGVHDIDYVNWILNDRPLNVYASGSIIKEYEEGANGLDFSSIILEYPNNIEVNIVLSRISDNYDQRMMIFGTKGKITMENPYNEGDKPISFPERYYNSYINELDYMIKSIINGTSLMITKNNCLDLLTITDYCDRSFEENNKFTIEYNTFRDFSNVDENVKLTYKKSRMNQNIEYVNKMFLKYLTFERKMTLDYVFEKLEKFVDISDPDVTIPNYYHGLQTAEAIRKDGLPDWFQLLGLIHDIGKIIYLWGEDNDGTTIKEQWGIVGDTFILGCKIPETIVYPEFNILNEDMKNDKYNTELGIYEEGCGLDSVTCSWGHDEYLYRILKYNNCNLPEEALYIIRFHSLYVYHKENEYQKLMNQKDIDMKPLLQKFNKYDLYTKSNNKFDNDTKNYYNTLIKKYLNGGVLWF